jgi:lipopolysaccharide transport system ATP-binding protein
MIRTRKLSKAYKLFDRPIHRLMDWVLPRKFQRGKSFWAVRDLDLDVPAGSSLGVIGVNGAGKSTLLKILTGTTLPTSGSFRIDGRVSSLLELGTGFHPEFTGRQNLHFGGRMAGLDAEVLEEKREEIIVFSELGDFIDQPVRTYSSGMVLRLGFALASSVDPDVLIIDEALAVGDLHFQQKCLQRMQSFHDTGTTVLIVSHDPSLIRKFCDNAILLDEGKLVDQGKPDQVLDYYTALLAEKYRDGGATTRIIRPGTGQEQGTDIQVDHQSSTGGQSSTSPSLLEKSGHRTGNFDAVITSVYMNSTGSYGNTRILPTGSRAGLVVRFMARKALAEATVGIMIRDRLGQEVFGMNTAYQQHEIGPLEANQVSEIQFNMTLDLGEGFYSVTVAIHTGVDHTRCCYDWVDQAMTFQILPDPNNRFEGLANLRPILDFRIVETTDQELEYAESLLADTSQAADHP